MAFVILTLEKKNNSCFHLEKIEDRIYFGQFRGKTFTYTSKTFYSIDQEIKGKESSEAAKLSVDGFIQLKCNQVVSKEYFFFLQAILQKKHCTFHSQEPTLSTVLNTEILFTWPKQLLKQLKPYSTFYTETILRIDLISVTLNQRLANMH